jgi:hypothetical protein
MAEEILVIADMAERVPQEQQWIIQCINRLAVQLPRYVMPESIQRSKIVRRKKGQHTSCALAMSAEIGLNVLSHKRRALQQDLNQLHVEVKIDNQRRMASFSSDEARELTNFFFDEVMGSQGLLQVSNIIKFYFSPPSDGVDNSTAARAEKMSNDKDCLPQIRDFFGAFSKAVRCENSRTSCFGRWQIMLRKLELFGRFTKLRQMAKDKHPDLLNFLTAKGNEYQTGQGRGWVSCSNRYLADSLGMTDNKLQCTCLDMQGIAELVKHFGPGITLVIPPYTGDK